MVRSSAHTNINCVATDMALEQTINREGKSHEEVIRVSVRDKACHC